MLSFSTWTSEVDSGAFCPDGSKSCVNARLPACQDRSILCLDKLPVSSGLVKKDVTENTTLNNFSLGAKFSYTCQTPGNLNLLPLLFGDIHILRHLTFKVSDMNTFVDN